MVNVTYIMWLAINLEQAPKTQRACPRLYGNAFRYTIVAWVYKLLCKIGHGGHMWQWNASDWGYHTQAIHLKY